MKIRVCTSDLRLVTASIDTGANLPAGTNTSDKNLKNGTSRN